MMRVLVIGLGSMGMRHLANIRRLEPEAHITVLRHRPADADVPPNADCVVHSLEAAIAAGVEIAFVCGPSNMHPRAAVALAQARVHLFVEKPLALDVTGARAIEAAAVASGRVLVVGYTLRFCAALRAMHAAAHTGAIGRVMSGRAEVGQYLPDWRPDADYRTSNSARTESGGGVVFELSHEIDYLRWLLGEIDEVDAMLGKLSDLDIDCDDTAELLLRFRSGVIGSIHLDMTAHSPTRQCRLIGTNGTLIWDGIAGETRVFTADRGWTTLLAAGTYDRNAMYLAQAAHVFACVRGTETPLVDGATGVRIVELAQAAVQAARSRNRVPV